VINRTEFYLNWFSFDIFTVRCLEGYFFPDTVYIFSVGEKCDFVRLPTPFQLFKLTTPLAMYVLFFFIGFDACLFGQMQ